LFEQVRRLWNINDEIKILRQLIAEIKKFHDKDKVIGNLNPYDLYVNIGDEQVTLILRPGIDLKWSYYCTRNTKDTDIFLLGCVFYFILTRGKHPFGYFWRLQHGDTSHHQLMAKNLFFLEACKNIDARKLIDRMIHFDPHKRPTIEEVCNHPMFREPNQIAPFLGEYAIEDPQLVDEYRPITIHDYFLMASHRFGDLKLERKAEQIQIRPGRYGNDYVNVIIASKSEDEKLIHYWTSLSQISIHSKNVLLPLYIDRDG